MSCDDVSIDFFDLFFSSLSMCLLIFQLEYCCIVQNFIRYTKCLKMGRNCCKIKKYNKIVQKLKYGCTWFFHIVDFEIF